MILQALLALPLLILVVPQSLMASFGLAQARQGLCRFGWLPQLVAQVAAGNYRALRKSRVLWAPGEIGIATECDLLPRHVVWEILDR